MWEKFAKNNPLGRVSTPEDIGKAVYLLTTDEAEYWNGNEIYVNGGSHLK
jgi:NAD(P)-dependent dehydrogenase (short-subunit alcohol dehydrogenase family)